MRRRALFLGSTLAVLGSCARTSTPPEHGESPVVAVPPPASDEDAGSTTAEPEAGILPLRGSHPSDAPPLTVPTGVSERARQNYEHLVKTYSSAYQTLDQMEPMIASACSINDSKCESQWRALADKDFELDNAFRFFHICKGSSREAKDYDEIEKAHRTHFTERRKRVQDSIDAALAATGSGAAQKWEQMKADVRVAHPQPCLSFACIDW